jgi:hypothetical protein
LISELGQPFSKITPEHRISIRLLHFATGGLSLFENPNQKKAQGLQPLGGKRALRFARATRSAPARTVQIREKSFEQLFVFSRLFLQNISPSKQHITLAN